MSKRTIKLSSLSEGLRKEVKKHLKEGRTKLGQMPTRLRKLIESEAFYGTDSDEYRPDMESSSRAIPKFTLKPRKNAGEFEGESGPWKVWIYTYNDGKKFGWTLLHRGESLVGGEGHSSLKAACKAAEKEATLDRYQHLKEGRTKMSMLPSKLANKILIEMEHDSSGNPIAPWDRKGPKSPHGSDLPYVPHSRINAGTYDIDGEFSSSDDIGDDDNFNVNVDDTELLSAMEDAKMQSENGYVVHVNKSPKGDYELSDWYDDESTVASYENGRKLNENKRASMKNKQIKLSSLSEGLRKEVKKHLKEGRTKLGQMPPKLANEILSEMNDMGSQFDSSGNPILPWGSNGSSK